MVEGRGLLRPGFAADVTIFDPKTIKACAPEWAEDYPAGTRRLIPRSEGIAQTIVNGKVVYEDGKLRGRLRAQYCAEPPIRRGSDSIIDRTL